MPAMLVSAGRLAVAVWSGGAGGRLATCILRTAENGMWSTRPSSSVTDALSIDVEFRRPVTVYCCWLPRSRRTTSCPGAGTSSFCKFPPRSAWSGGCVFLRGKALMVACSMCACTRTMPRGGRSTLQPSKRRLASVFPCASIPFSPVPVGTYRPRPPSATGMSDREQQFVKPSPIAVSGLRRNATVGLYSACRALLGRPPTLRTSADARRTAHGTVRVTGMRLGARTTRPSHARGCIDGERGPSRCSGYLTTNPSSVARQHSRHRCP